MSKTFLVKSHLCGVQVAVKKIQTDTDGQWPGSQDLCAEGGAYCPLGVLFTAWKPLAKINQKCRAELSHPLSFCVPV